MNNDLKHIRRDYDATPLDESIVDKDPIKQFEQWFDELLKHHPDDPTAMVLSTVDEHHYPDSRVVLLKEIKQDRLIFYTNYQSKKAEELRQQPVAALNFYWPKMCRQVRIRGHVDKVSAKESDEYFTSRPKDSQVGAIVSPQSQPVTHADLQSAFDMKFEQYKDETILRPEHWGGYALTPFEFEFWHGRKSRLHDRIHYQKQDNAWIIQRLAP